MGRGRFFDFKKFSFFKRVAPIFLLTLSFNSCGGSGGTVSSQEAGNVQVLLNATISSSVPEGGGTVTCANTCEFSFSVTDSNNNTIVKAQDSFSKSFKCNANEVPASGQRFSSVFNVDSRDPLVQAGGIVEASCGPPGNSLIDIATFSFFTDSQNFNIQSCQADNNCAVDLQLTSIKDQINQSGALQFLETLQCPTLNFLHTSACPAAGSTDPKGTTCSLIELAQTAVGCLDNAQTCGNNKKEGSEECDGTDSSCGSGKLCGAPQTKDECKCLTMAPGCGNGIVEGGETCETCPANVTCAALPSCGPGEHCNSTSCTCEGGVPPPSTL